MQTLQNQMAFHQICSLHVEVVEEEVVGCFQGQVGEVVHQQNQS